MSVTVSPTVRSRSRPPVWRTADTRPADQAFQRVAQGVDQVVRGDDLLFAHAGAIEAAWAAVAPALSDPPQCLPYACGSSGPAAANHLIAGDGGWHNPEGAPIAAA